MVFNNISVLSWQSVLLVVETGGPRENHQPVAYDCTVKVYERLYYMTLNKMLLLPIKGKKRYNKHLVLI